MITKKEVERRFNVLLEEVATSDFYKIDLTNRVNCYNCSTCGHITKTKDVAAGVTPMFFRCEKCTDYAQSSFYKDTAPLQQPTIEWYRPTLEELIKKRNNAPYLEHILAGGLAHRKIK